MCVEKRGQRQLCLCSAGEREQFDEGERAGRVDFGAHIGRGGARESSRQSGRTAEKAAAWPISARLPPQTQPHRQRAFPGNGGVHGQRAASRQSRLHLGEFVVQTPATTVRRFLLLICCILSRLPSLETTKAGDASRNTPPRTGR